MTDPRDELLRRIRAIRSGLDRDVVRRLDLAKEGKVPYDRDTAREAVRQFLAVKQDGGKFKAKLLDALKKGG